MKRCLLVLGLIISCCLTALPGASSVAVACPITSYSYQGYSTYQSYPTYQPAYIATYAAFAVAVPVYSIGLPQAYAAPAVASPPPSAAVATPAPSPCEKELTAMRQEFASLRAELAQMRGATANAPAPHEELAPPKRAVAPANESPYLGVFVSRCASCHDKAVSAKKGGALTLCDAGREVPLTAAQVLEVLRRVDLPKDDKQRMPKGGDLTDDDFGKIGSLVHRKR